MTHISKDKRAYAKFTGVNKHDEFLNRISKTLYYTKLPVTDCLSLPVTELAAEIFTEVKNGQTLERLDVEEASRISRNACVSPCSLVLALLYLERLKDCNPEYLQRVAPSELFLVSLMIASKFLHDDGEEDEVFNTEWAKCGNLSIAKMNRLEKDFLKAINWSVYVHNKDFWDRLHRLEKHIAYKEACKRGWFSYTELNTLFNSTQLAELVYTAISISSVCFATYAAGLITLLGSAIVASNLPGTLISSKQYAQPTSALNLQLTSSTHRISQIELQEQIENILLNSVSKPSEICNNSSVEKDITIRVNWKWIIDSVIFWLPNCSHLKSACLNNWKNKYNENNLYVTKLDFLTESETFSRYSNDEVENIITKQDIDLSLKMAADDWKYYIAYFSKISLSHGQ
ncbi:PREDICTED: protein CNPPD1 [Ceratosolen solmsi marchali]|uniref:Protein CNPPD1 n=1 Tax=Ceratosolen solmsi marchali TaxID=326594 RepID=A0AAJ6YLX1_9HYME|nr:PREDICTED: protein CNPPD1 [Ceratosolen solmsi marchali]